MQSPLDAYLCRVCSLPRHQSHQETEPCCPAALQSWTWWALPRRLYPGSSEGVFEDLRDSLEQLAILRSSKERLCLSQALPTVNHEIVVSCPLQASADQQVSRLLDKFLVDCTNTTAVNIQTLTAASKTKIRARLLSGLAQSGVLTASTIAVPSIVSQNRLLREAVVQGVASLQEERGCQREQEAQHWHRRC